MLLGDATDGRSIHPYIYLFQSIPFDPRTHTPLLTAAPPGPGAPRGASGAPPYSRAAAVCRRGGRVCDGWGVEKSESESSPPLGGPCDASIPYIEPTETERPKVSTRRPRRTMVDWGPYGCVDGRGLGSMTVRLRRGPGAGSGVCDATAVADDDVCVASRRTAAPLHNQPVLKSRGWVSVGCSVSSIESTASIDGRAEETDRSTLSREKNDGWARLGWARHHL